MLPYWRHAPPSARHEVDVVVVGAGVCGLSAGWELSARGLRVAIVERSHVAAGASGRNAGFLMRGMAENYAVAIDLYGLETARRLWRWTEENLQILLSRGASTLASFRRVPSVLLALSPGAQHTDEGTLATEEMNLRRSVDLLRRDGFDAAWLEAHDDDAWRALKPVGGLVNPHDGAVNPWDLLRLLAALLAGVIHEHQAVVGMSVGPGGRGVLVRTTAAEFLASRVLVCTNAYGPLLAPSLRGRVTPERGQMLAIRPDPPVRLDFSYYANRGYEYFRQTTDGVVVVGGRRLANPGGERTYDLEPGEVVQGEIEAFARGPLRLHGPVVARWAGTMGFSTDGLPIVEPVNDLAPGAPADCVWFCGGFTGHGMSLAARTARHAVERMLGEPVRP